MAEYTQNYNLKKPAEEDFYNVKDFNDNADIIDQALKAHDDALATKETPQGAQEKADAALNSAKQYTDQEVAEVSQALDAHKAAAAPHSGHETPAGAQAKADAALAGANTYTDQEVGEVAQALNEHLDDNASTSKKGHVQLTDSVSSTSTTTAATPNSVKQAYDKANAALPKTGGTMTGILTAQSNTSYTVRQVRNIILSTADADVDAMQNGDIWIKYK